MFDYPVTLTPDGDTVMATFADVPEAITFGADEDEALLNAIDALETALSFYVEARKPLPAASRPAPRTKDRATIGAGMRQAGRIPGDDRTRNQKSGTRPAPGMAYAAGGSPVRSPSRIET